MKESFVVVRDDTAPTEEESREAASSNTPAERLSVLAHQSKALALLVAKNPHAPSSLLEKLASPVRMRLMRSNPPSLGYNAWTDPDMAEWLVDDEIRREVAKNPSTPPKALLTIACHFPTEVSQNPALQMAFLEDASLLYQLDPGVLMLLASTEEFSHLAPQIANHPDKALRQRLAKDHRTPLHLLELLQKDPDPIVSERAKETHRNMVDYYSKRKK